MEATFTPRTCVSTSVLQRWQDIKRARHNQTCSQLLMSEWNNREVCKSAKAIVNATKFHGYIMAILPTNVKSSHSTTSCQRSERQYNKHSKLSAAIVSPAWSISQDNSVSRNLQCMRHQRGGCVSTRFRQHLSSGCGRLALMLQRDIHAPQNHKQASRYSMMGIISHQTQSTAVIDMLHMLKHIE